ncbi:MAG: alanine--glyoxylate aminotransferase family protein [Candidatus Aerophobetes bacterium]|nr:alanine--glyoxylate aminotransferase family protein [Candidatus Aerophobetes bacterium]
MFTPGPTPLPEEVRIAQAKQIIHHRTGEFSQIFRDVCQELKNVLQTKNDVLLFTASGTGAMEAAVANLLSPEDKVLVIRGGKFGQRWAEIADAFGVKVIPLDVKWGTVIDPRIIKEELARNLKIKAVFTQLVETSTGVVYDIKNIAKVVRETDAILVVDAISGLGAEPLPTDEWGVDVVVGGSQKALMIPPGLSFVSLSERAWRLVERSTLPKYYWDFKKAKKSLSKLQTPYTPAVSLICALEESLKLTRKEGWQNCVQRHHHLAEATRKGVLAMGLDIFSQAPSNVVTAVKMPPGIDARKLRKIMSNKYGVQVAGGQGKLAGKIIRIAHLGWMDSLDVISAISALEMALSELGYSLELGKGVKAAEEVLGEIR